MNDSPLILLSNDDGVHAPGHVKLREALSDFAHVVTVAPLSEQSANSHSITLDRPLRHYPVSQDVHAIDGTPADCIYVALHHPEILPRHPDIVVSGINHGPNLGWDVFYSGTVAAAREAAFRGIASMAISMLSDQILDAAVTQSVAMVKRFCQATHPMGEAVLLNINFPPKIPKGTLPTQLGRRRYVDDITVRSDPRGKEYFWIGGTGEATHDPIEGADTEAIDQGFVSVTPLLLKATNKEHLGMAAWVAGEPSQFVTKELK